MLIKHYGPTKSQMDVIGHARFLGRKPTGLSWRDSC